MGRGSGSGRGALRGGYSTDVHSQHQPSRHELTTVAPMQQKSSGRPSPPVVIPKGLENVGNSCYANAALQCLLNTALTHALLDPKSITTFRRYSSNLDLLELGSGSFDVDSDGDSVGSGNENDRLKRLSKKERRRKGREEKKLQETSQWLTRELTSITREYTNFPVGGPHTRSRSMTPWAFLTSPSSSTAPVVNPGVITKRPDRLSKCLRPYQQEDAHEFLRALLSTLTMNGQNTKLSSLFDGLLESAVTCQVCRHISLTRDRYMDLSLDISHDGITSLEDALVEFTKTELLDNENKVMCTSCKVKQPVAKGLRLATAPSILVCHLKRFSVNRYGRLRRLHKRIQFPQRLEIGNYMSKVNRATPPPYELVGVLVHQGHSCDSGHYLAYVKAGNFWYKTNDSVVTKVDISVVLEQQAYILIYEVAGMRHKHKMRGIPTTPSTSSASSAEMNVDGRHQGQQQQDNSIFSLLCGAAALNENMMFDLCCHSSGGVHDETRQCTTPMPDHQDDVTTMTQESDHYTTCSDTSAKRLCKSSSGGNLKGLETEASQAYRPSSSTRTHSFSNSDPGFGRRTRELAAIDTEVVPAPARHHQRAHSMRHMLRDSSAALPPRPDGYKKRSLTCSGTPPPSPKFR